MFQEHYAIRSIGDAAPDTRARFIRRTYLHLALALAAFAGLETILLQMEIFYVLTQRLFEMPYGWLMVLGGFIVAGWMATRFAHSQSKGVQYAGLFLYVVAEAVIFVPLMIMALSIAGSGLLIQAALMTGLLFAGLTATVLITR